MRSSGGNIISGHCTMAGPGWTTHRAQGQLRSTAPAPTRDQNSFHKLSHHGEYLRLYLYISTLISIYLCSVCCCCGGLGGDTAATCVIIPANIPQPDTRQTALWWCSCGGQHTGDTQQFANPRPALQHMAACCPVLAAHSDTCPQNYHNRISISINIVTVVSCPWWLDSSNTANTD